VVDRIKTENIIYKNDIAIKDFVANRIDKMYIKTLGTFQYSN